MNALDVVCGDGHGLFAEIDPQPGLILNGAHADAWHPYRSDPALPADLESRVHVWRVALDDVSAGVADTLSDDERERAERLARPQDRARFIAARGVLRTILADLLPTGDAPMPRALRLGYGAAGKPVLVDHPRLCFNVAHSEGLALIAITRAGEVGIDVEKRHAIGDVSAIARLVFTEAERAAMLGYPEPEREAFFYRTWTHKEALIKAMGVGIATLDDPDAASLAHAALAWRITTLPHLEGFAAALAHPRDARGLRLWAWPTV